MSSGIRRIVFSVREQQLDDVLDALLPRVPRGVRLTPTGAGEIRVVALGDEAVAAAPDGAIADEVPADWRERAGAEDVRVEVAGRLVVRGPGGAPAPAGVPEVVVERRGASFGSGEHPTTRMCLELLLGLEPMGAVSDLGCGLGTLAIAAAKLGWSPVSGVDIDAAGVETARANAARNGVAATFSEADLLDTAPPLAPCVLINAPKAVHAHLAASLTGEVRAVIASSLLSDEFDEVLDGYLDAGLEVVTRIEEDGWVAALLARAGVEWEPAAARSERTAPPPADELPPDRPAAELLDPEPITAAGLGQLATSVQTGGVIVSSSRLVEQGCRAALVLVPGLFRFDMTPSGEALGIAFRPLCRAPMRWRAEHETLDGFRRGEGEPLVFHGEIDHPDGRLVSMLQVLSLSDEDQGALHLVTKCAVHPTVDGAVRAS